MMCPACVHRPCVRVASRLWTWTRSCPNRHRPRSSHSTKHPQDSCMLLRARSQRHRLTTGKRPRGTHQA
eukprot:7719081-Alexandrium_andersonii.AAC.1